MPSRLQIEENLLKQVQWLGGHRAKGETVNEALREYVRRLNRFEASEERISRSTRKAVTPTRRIP